MADYLLRHAADDDLVNAAAWIARDNPATAARFLGRAFATFDFIARWPEAAPWARLPAKRHQRIRCRPLPRPFHNYLVFYRIKARRVDLLRVLHGATNWQTDVELFG